MYQKITIVGNLGRDPEMRYLPSGTPVTNFSVATNHTYTTSGEKAQETTWFRVAVFGKQAEAVSQYLHKGSKVLVEGRLIPDKETGGPKVWQKNDGSWAASFEVNANTVRFLDSRGDNAVGGNTTPSAVDDLPAAEDEIPF